MLHALTSLLLNQSTIVLGFIYLGRQVFFYSGPPDVEEERFCQWIYHGFLDTEYESKGESGNALHHYGDFSEVSGLRQKPT